MLLKSKNDTIVIFHFSKTFEANIGGWLTVITSLIFGIQKFTKFSYFWYCWVWTDHYNYFL